MIYLRRTFRLPQLLVPHLHRSHEPLNAMGLGEHTSVAFEDLQHFAALQVPYIYF